MLHMYRVSGFSVFLQENLISRLVYWDLHLIGIYLTKLRPPFKLFKTEENVILSVNLYTQTCS